MTINIDYFQLSKNLEIHYNDSSNKIEKFRIADKRARAFSYYG